MYCLFVARLEHNYRYDQKPSFMKHAHDCDTVFILLFPFVIVMKRLGFMCRPLSLLPLIFLLLIVRKFMRHQRISSELPISHSFDASLNYMVLK